MSMMLIFIRIPTHHLFNTALRVSTHRSLCRDESKFHCSIRGSCCFLSYRQNVQYLANLRTHFSIPLETIAAVDQDLLEYSPWALFLLWYPRISSVDPHHKPHPADHFSKFLKTLLFPTQNFCACAYGFRTSDE